MRSRAVSGSSACGGDGADGAVVRDRRVELSNVAEVSGAGAPGVAVVRAIRDAEDPEAAARELLRAALDRQQ